MSGVDVIKRDNEIKKRKPSARILIRGYKNWGVRKIFRLRNSSNEPKKILRGSLPF